MYTLYLVNALCPPALVILPWAVLVSILSVYKLHCDSQYMLDAANTNRFYGEKLKQAIYEPRPRNMCCHGNITWLALSYIWLNNINNIGVIITFGRRVYCPT